jgi:uncharacterized membrane protein YsdA (DUF1294 family)
MVTAALFAYDNGRAARAARVPESALLGAACGGSPAGLLVTQLFRQDAQDHLRAWFWAVVAGRFSVGIVVTQRGAP